MSFLKIPPKVRTTETVAETAEHYRNIRAETVADKIVNNCFFVFGIPESILAVGGKQYQSKLLDLVYEYLDIRGLKTTPCNPRCNGLSERSVQTSKNMIKTNIHDEQNDWDVNLPKLTYAYNTSVQESTKQTPFDDVWKKAEITNRYRATECGNNPQRRRNGGTK